MTTEYFVRATVDPSGLFASCLYFYDQAGTRPVEGSQLKIPLDAGGCMIGQADGSELVLLGASFKTLGAPAGMNAKNFTPSDDENTLVIPMPTASMVEKGVVLLFSNAGTQVDALYASSDPVVVNSDD